MAFIFASRVKTAGVDEKQSSATFVDLAALGNPEVGARVRALRAFKNWNQVELAEAAGVTQSDVSRLENSPQNCKLRVFSKVAQALGVGLSDLFEGSSLTVPANPVPVNRADQ